MSNKKQIINYNWKRINKNNKVKSDSTCCSIFFLQNKVTMEIWLKNDLSTKSNKRKLLKVLHFNVIGKIISIIVRGAKLFYYSSYRWFFTTHQNIWNIRFKKWKRTIVIFNKARKNATKYLYVEAFQPNIK